MARLSRLLSAVSLGVAVTAAVGAAVVAVERNDRARKAPAHLAESANGRVIVKFRERASILSAANTAGTAAATTGPQKASAMSARLGIALTDGRALGARTQVLKANGMTSAALATALAADGEVEWAEVDHKRFIQASPVNDPLYPSGQATATPASGQWYLRGTPATGGTGQISSINIEPAWAITKGSTAIVIGDVDTGITGHPDLDSKMLAGYDFIADVPTANDGNGRDNDPSDPGDYVTAAENSKSGGDFFGCNDDGTGAAVAENSSWHGTQTASILGAATNNGVGMAGAGYQIPVVAARALGKCGGYDSDIIAAAEWAGGLSVSGAPVNNHPARVINMSLGATGACTQAYIDALTALRNNRVIVVAAAGNDEGLPVGTPANCKPAPTDTDQTPVVIAVAAVRHAGTKVGFSDIGPEVTIAAPGGNCVNGTITSATPCLYPIITALNSGTTTPVVGGGTYSNGVNYSVGTSFATPMVSATVALMLSADQGMSNADVIRILKATARPFPTVSDTTPQPPVCTAPNASAAQDECICTTSTCGAGLLDAGAAVQETFSEAGGNGGVIGPIAHFSPSTNSVAVGSTVTLDGSASLTSSTGAAISSYTWSVDDTSKATLSATSGKTVVLTGVAVGQFNVTLSIVDADGRTASTTVLYSTTAAATTGGSTGGSSSGGGGGGAANPAWLIALAAAGLLLRPRARKPRA